MDLARSQVFSREAVEEEGGGAPAIAIALLRALELKQNEHNNQNPQNTSVQLASTQDLISVSRKYKGNKKY